MAKVIWMRHWREMSVKELKTELKDRNISQSGNKEELIKKLEEYEIIDAEIPLNEQPEKIQNALIKYYKRYNVDESRPVSDLIAKMPNNPASINYNETKLFAQNLSKNGIKALKYKQLSHPSKKKPSDTFVVFDDKVIDILTKLGIAGAVILTPEMKGTVLTNSKLDT